MSLDQAKSLRQAGRAGRGDLHATEALLRALVQHIASLSPAELGVIDGAVAGAFAASKAMVLDANGHGAMPDGGRLFLSSDAVAAAGSSASDATAMSDQINIVTGADGAKGVALPAAADRDFVAVVNTTAFPLLVYPVSGGNDNINSLAEDAAFTVAPFAFAIFSATSATQWYTPDIAARGSDMPSMRMKSVLFDDFLAAAIDGRWSSTAGSGTGNQAATTVAGAKNGRITLTSASDDGAHGANNTALTADQLNWKAENGGLVLEGWASIDDVSEAYFFAGFTDVISTTVEAPIFMNAADIDSDATDACGLLYDIDATDDRWTVGGVANGTDTAPTIHATLAPVDNTGFYFRVEVSAAGTVSAWVNGTLIGTVASAVTPTVALTPCVVVGNRSANQVVATLDYLKVEQNR